MPVLGLELLFVVLWSSGFIGAKYGLPYAGPFTLLLIRYVIVAGLLGCWLWTRGEFRFSSRPAIARAAIIGVLAHAIWLSAALGGIALGVSPWIVALITALQPMLTSVLSGPVLGESILPVQWGGTGVGLVGVVLVVITKLEGASGGSPWGYLLPFVAAASMTVATLYQRHLNSNQVERLQVIPSLFVQAVASAIFLCPLAVLIEGRECAVDWAIHLCSGLVGDHAVDWLLWADAKTTGASHRRPRGQPDVSDTAHDPVAQLPPIWGQHYVD
jgi:drug/metabolite transporter (DMT)-like permease